MIRKFNEGYSVGDKVTFDANARGVHPKITTGTIVFKGRTVAMHGFPAEDMYTVKLDNGNTVTIGNFEIEAAGGNPVTEKTRTNHKKNYKEANAYNLDDAESRRKEIADRFGRTFIPDDHILVCKDGKKLNIQVGKKYKCTACNGQRVEIVSIDELFPGDTGDSALITAYYRGNMIAIGSNQLYESVNKKKLTKEGYNENEEIANLLFDIETTGDSRLIDKAYNFIDKYCDFMGNF